MTAETAAATPGQTWTLSRGGGHENEDAEQPFNTKPQVKVKNVSIAREAEHVPHQPPLDMSRVSRVSSRVPPTLAEWLADLRAHHRRITLQHGRPHLDQPTSHDRHMLARHQHALTIAADGSHPDWWRHAAGLTDTPPHRDHIPTVVDPDSDDWTAYACACCGQPATIIDQQLLPWCPPHTPHGLR